MKIVITGGAGFIGMHTATQLLKEGQEVHIIDHFHPYYSPERKKKHIEIVNQVGSVYFYEHNLLDRETTVELIDQIRPDVVIHLAALPGVSYSLKEPLLYVDYDIKITINVLEAAGKAGVKKVVFASSSSVYGEQPSVPLKEEMASGRVISPYAASKWSAESFCHVYAHLYSYSVSVLRFFTVYGPWGRPDMAVAKFIKRAMNGEPIEIYGKGSGRDYTYVDDVVNGILLSLNDPQNYAVWNIGAGSPTSMDRLLELLKKEFPQMNIHYGDHRVGDVFSTWADISKAKEELGFQPVTSIEEGMKRTIEWAYENKVYL
ncbi:NAD-dependent epimerase/dehydratase family protein [Bacillus sp. FJAT-42315]|uniref:NAD-dependent epimerase/dehydratase family protein n=1 Tax=Bacillus sp. FJAT-42315 TaxID=2014077 RepID=UPI000C235427|nr:NAD-dependent epimerase/dehydratase family protein [Bacillus sp. FJAT-42315]